MLLLGKTFSVIFNYHTISGLNHPCLVLAGHLLTTNRSQLLVKA